mgnify:CR=1 FL=1
MWWLVSGHRKWVSHVIGKLSRTAAITSRLPIWVSPVIGKLPRTPIARVLHTSASMTDRSRVLCTYRNWHGCMKQHLPAPLSFCAHIVVSDVSDYLFCGPIVTNAL